MSIQEFLKIRKGKTKWNRVLEKCSISISYEAGTPCVELIAVMAKYNPFAEKAGMRKIV